MTRPWRHSEPLHVFEALQIEEQIFLNGMKSVICKTQNIRYKSDAWLASIPITKKQNRLSVVVSFRGGRTKQNIYTCGQSSRCSFSLMTDPMSLRCCPFSMAYERMCRNTRSNICTLPTIEAKRSKVSSLRLLAASCEAKRGRRAFEIVIKIII